MEEMLWDEITNSAKKKFDYKTFAQEIPESLADNFLFQAILLIAGNRPVLQIASELQMNLILAGFHMELDDLITFINEKKSILDLEVFASQIAMDLLADGTPPEHVYANVCQLLR